MENRKFSTTKHVIKKLIKIKYLIIGLVGFLLVYTFLWSYLLNNSSKSKPKRVSFQKVYFSKEQSSNNINWPEEQVLSARSFLSPTPIRENLPESFKINMQKRRQAFNLSCEFAAASAVIYHFTNTGEFSVKNELSAEKLLMSKIGVSQNPNVGIRMGNNTPEDEQKLYKNLNQGFGGTDYYGVHAPPFISLFGNYKLAAVPLNKNEDLNFLIKKAISSNHLVMAWIKIGYGKPIDVALSYGVSVPIIRGEHSVVINGYNSQGVFVMDPGIGVEKFVGFKDFFNATEPFAMPFLEIYPSSIPFAFVPTFPIDKPTGLDRSILKIKVENASKRVGAGSEIAEILKDFGYSILEVNTKSCEECIDLKIEMKENLKDYLDLLKKDLELAFYNKYRITLDLEASESADMIVTVGE